MRNLAHLNPYQLHQHLINEYILNQPGSTKQLGRDRSKDKRDIDVIKENHQFLWDDDDQANITWEQQLARKYYEKLFKEYTISDLQRYKENKIALRWRIEKEVVAGKGQFICGNKVCTTKDDLKTWEVNFAYAEHGVKKNALVKLRLCPACSAKLNYRTKKREIKRLKKKLKKCSKDPEEPSTSREQHETTRTEETPTKQADANDEEEPADADVPEEKLEQIAKQCWTKATEVEDKSREEEFDEFLEDLLL